MPLSSYSPTSLVGDYPRFIESVIAVKEANRIFLLDRTAKVVWTVEKGTEAPLRGLKIIRIIHVFSPWKLSRERLHGGNDEFTKRCALSLNAHTGVVQCDISVYNYMLGASSKDKDDKVS